MEDLKFDFKNSLVVKNEDAVLINENIQYLQNIKLEAVTNEGDLFYDEDFGFSLEQFLHRRIDEMLFLEIKQRIIIKLSKREYVDTNSINIEIKQKEEKLYINVKFKINEVDSNIIITLDRTRVEVI